MQCHPEQSEGSRVHQRGRIRDSSLAFRMTNVFRNSFLNFYFDSPLIRGIYQIIPSSRDDLTWNKVISWWGINQTYPPPHDDVLWKHIVAGDKVVWKHPIRAKRLDYNANWGNNKWMSAFHQIACRGVSHTPECTHLSSVDVFRAYAIRPYMAICGYFINNKWQESIKNVSHVLNFRYATKVRKSFGLCNTLTHRFARRGATIFNCIYIHLNKYMHIYVFCMQKILHLTDYSLWKSKLTNERRNITYNILYI